MENRFSRRLETRGIAKPGFAPLNNGIKTGDVTVGDVVRLELIGAVAVLILDQPPVNALGAELRSALYDAVVAAEADADVKAIVILAEGRTWPAGADISEFGTDEKAPGLNALCDRIEACTKPVVAGLHGTVLGGGLELALAAHLRLAVPGTRLGFPEVTLGLVPGAGGAQRAPRLAGAEVSLEMMLKGTPITAKTALEAGLIDRVVKGDLAQVSVAVAIEAPVRRSLEQTKGFEDPAAFFAAVAKARTAIAANSLPAPARIVDCVEAALLLPAQQWRDYEAAAFADLVTSEESVALRYAFFAERRAAKMPGPAVRARDIVRATVIGADEMGCDLARKLVLAGIEVTLADKDVEALAPGLHKIEADLAAAVASGQLSAQAQAQAWALLGTGLAEQSSYLTDLLVLSGTFARPGAEVSLPVTNVPVVTFGRVGPGDARAMGLVIAGPRLAELLVRETTGPEAMASVLAVLRRLGFVVVQARGLGIGGPVMRAMVAALDHLEARDTPSAALEVLRLWGMADGAPRRDAASARAEAQVLGAMANAGLYLLGDGKALRPSDIDLTLMLGHEFPRHRGGPMLWADQRGPLVLRSDLEGWAQEDPDIWTPAPLLDKLIEKGIGIGALNEG